MIASDSFRRLKSISPSKAFKSRIRTAKSVGVIRLVPITKLEYAMKARKNRNIIESHLVWSMYDNADKLNWCTMGSCR